MNREEILKEIRFSGEYTRDVKRRLNHLLKKYHPDKNKDDTKTILTLYEIKKELENGTIVYTPKIEKVREKQDIKNTFYNIENDVKSVIFINKMLYKVNKTKSNVQDNLNDLYSKLNNYYEQHNVKQDELSNLYFLVNQLEEEIKSITKLDRVDVLFAVFFILLCVTIYIFNLWFLIIFIVILLLIEVYYIYYRNSEFIKKSNQLKDFRICLKTVLREMQQITGSIDKIQLEEFKLKREKSRISNDLQFYTYELSKLNNNDSSLEKEYSDDDNKTFGRK